MDKSTRNAIQNATQAARQLLEASYREQLEGTYDILPDGHIAAQPGSHLSDRQQILRERLVATLAHKRSLGLSAKEAVADYLRDAAFTTFNRFVALKMLEARGLVQECVSKGEASSGFKEFGALSPGLVAIAEKGYRLYLESLFDELSRGLKVLFDRQDVASLLWPDRQTLLDLLAILNAPELAAVWGADETIGWVYQYWNSAEERKAMREASAAPRNSRELAVRNQFFTPRYVVEFLTDNTLGRIWYEMTQGETRLAEQCRYLVRRPTEIFLREGEQAPEPVEQGDDNLTQEALLRQPVYIPHRPLKDPREIRLLDPACGSMHFGLYAFDLFEVIYEEAWDRGYCPALHEDFESKEALLRELPRLIIEHNIHGVDIDPRAVQIAALSLWLRAQKSWRNLPPGERPEIRRTNIVCAEPMPGDRALLDDFVQHLDPPLVGELVKTVFDKMQLAGEAGTLLKIEEEIRTAIEDARQEAERQRGDLFGSIDVADADFFATAEARIYAALQAYAESAESGDYRRRLFAEDAARGFAFIDLCRKRYDAVVMNPPFGEPSRSLLTLLENSFIEFNKNLLCAFLFRQYEMRDFRGRVGAIFDRTAIVKNSYEKFRRAFLVNDNRLYAQCDLGWEVLDANVEVTASILGESLPGNQAVFFDMRPLQIDETEIALQDAVEYVRESVDRDFTISASSEFSRFPNAVLGYDFPRVVKYWFRNLRGIEDQGVQVLAGHTILAERYFRYWWEVPLVDAFSSNASWQRFYNGGDYSRFNSALCDAVFYGGDGCLIKDHESTILRNLRLQQKGKLGFGKRGEFIDAHVLPEGFVSSVEGQAVVIHDGADAKATLAILNSVLFQSVINLYCGQHKYPGYVHLFPCVDWSNDYLRTAGEAAMEVFQAKERLETVDETHPRFLNAESLNLWDQQAVDQFSTIVDWVRLREVQVNDEILKAYQGGEDAKAFIEPYRVKEPATGGVAGERPETFVFESRIQFAVGVSLGRWDIRYATGERQPPELLDPFDPLPVCPPGMLQNADGLPAAPEDVPADYPLRITWSGILVDDPGHSEDIVTRVREALAVIWGERAAAIEQEACEILGIKQLRDYFAEKKAGSPFFKDHLSRYSKSRRQAPIYWPLSTASGTYTFWIYYHRFDPNTFYSLLRLAGDKLGFEERKLAELTQEAGPDPTARQRKAIDAQDNFVSELRGFITELNRIAPLWKPDLNDGVIINSAPVWRLLRHTPWQKKVKACWDKLAKGDYDWAHLAMHLWPEGATSQ